MRCTEPASPDENPGRVDRLAGGAGGAGGRGTPRLALAACAAALALAALGPAHSHAAPVALPAPVAARDWESFKVQAARRLVEADPEASYMGEPPPVLLAIPVLEVELNRDGSVRRVRVVREPGDAKDTIGLAIEAVHRAAPYGDMSSLRRPWRYTEVFLFNDERRFKPATLDR